ncbi:MAG TPA: Crp/Fnr family transcriptional regulator [Sphingomicrobium sp.]|jgi:CRP-like cAMP-binding protein
MPEKTLIRRLDIFARLADEDKRRLTELCAHVETVPAKHDIVSDEERPEHLHLVLRGWAARYKLLPGGERQIVGFLLPGDFADLHVTLLGQMDHGIVALTPCRVAYVDSRAIDRLTADSTRVARALWWSTLVDEGVLRNWIVNNGRRDAYARIAHLLCELHARMQMIGLVEDHRLDLPLTQEEIADATSLTSVHTNRTLQRLRADGLIELKSQVLRINDLPGLKRAAGFDATYLHLKRRPLVDFSQPAA